MLAAAVPAGVTSTAVRVSSPEILPAATEALRRVPAASHVEAARTVTANALGRVLASKMDATRVRSFSVGVRKVLASEKRSARAPPGRLSAKLAALET